MSETWDLQPASWKSVVFAVESVDDSWTRRVVEYQYPQRAGADLEDMGREPLRMAFRAIWFGPGYKAECQKFLSAFEAGGSGTLVHPVFGSVYAQCTRMSMRHTHEQGNSASADLEFVEDQLDQAAFTVETDTSSTAANEARAAADDATLAVEALA